VPEVKKNMFHNPKEVPTSCAQYFSEFDFGSMKVHKSQFQSSINSLLLVLEQKIVLTGDRKSCPRNFNMFSHLTFEYK
jgi:hypothetical protein